MVDYENIAFEEHDGIARLTVDRPRALNALNAATLREIHACVDALPSSVRVLIVTGAGDKAFVAGADIKEMASMSSTEVLGFTQEGHAALAALEALPLPVIAAVNGFALGGGCELMLACDFAVAAETARFGQPEVALGVTPGLGGTVRLSRRVGPAWSRRLLVTGEQIDARQALTIGLVTEVVPATTLHERCQELAVQIRSQAPLAVAWAKRASQLAEEAALSAGLEHEQRVFASAFATEDQKEGMAAFVEKRTVTWKGR